MVMGMERVTMRHVRVVRRLLVIAGLGVLGGFAMVLRGVLVMFCRFLVVLVD
jgi:hypothetical protein